MTGQPQLEVLAPGAHAALQDAGRHGLRRVGVPWAGALDPRLMRLANALAGQPPQAAVIEAVDGGLRLAARHGPVRLAVAGDAVLDLQTADGRRAVPAWCALTLQDGEVLTLRSLRRGRLAALAVQGLAPAPVLGSASTYARAGPACTCRSHPPGTTGPSVPCPGRRPTTSMQRRWQPSPPPPGA